MSESSTATVSVWSLTILQRLDLVLAGHTFPNHVRLRRSVFRNSSDDETWNEEVHIPAQLDSVEALQFIGLKKSAAEQVLTSFNRENSMHGHPPIPVAIYDLIDFATGSLHGHEDAIGPEHDWIDCLKGMGIRKSTRTGICDPRFDSIRYTQTAREWAEETLRDSWNFLVSLDARIKMNHQQLQNVSEDRVRLRGGGGPQHKSSSVGSSKPKDRNLTIIPSGENLPEIGDDRVLFYKGGSQERFAEFKQDNGSLNTEKIVSTPPGDFSRRKFVYYFTKQKTVAWVYARYAKTRMPALNCGVLSLAVPRDLISDVYPVVGEEWYTLVWSSRGPEFKQEQRDIERSYNQYAVLTGPCCSMSNAQVARLDDKHKIEVMKLQSGEKASQWVIMDEDRMQEICDRSVDKVWFLST